MVAALPVQLAQGRTAPAHRRTCSHRGRSPRRAPAPGRLSGGGEEGKTPHPVPRRLRLLRFGDDLLRLDGRPAPAARSARMLARHPDPARRGNGERELSTALRGPRASPRPAAGWSGRRPWRPRWSTRRPTSQGPPSSTKSTASPASAPDAVRRRGADRAEAVGGRGRGTAAEGRQQRRHDGVVRARVRPPSPGHRSLPGARGAAPQETSVRGPGEVLGQQAPSRAAVLVSRPAAPLAADVDDRRVGGGRP